MIEITKITINKEDNSADVTLEDEYGHTIFINNIAIEVNKDSTVNIDGGDMDIERSIFKVQCDLYSSTIDDGIEDERVYWFSKELREFIEDAIIEEYIKNMITYLVKWNGIQDCGEKEFSDKEKALELVEKKIEQKCRVVVLPHKGYREV